MLLIQIDEFTETAPDVLLGKSGFVFRAGHLLDWAEFGWPVAAWVRVAHTRTG